MGSIWRESIKEAREISVMTEPKLMTRETTNATSLLYRSRHKKSYVKEERRLKSENKRIVKRARILLPKQWYIVLFSYSLLSYLLVAPLAIAQGKPAPSSSKVQEAISICREKLAADPHFPKVQHSLAQLLDSQIEGDHPDNSMVTEVIHLYEAVGNPPSEVTVARVPPASVRFESLLRAGTIARDVLFDTSKAISLYTAALEIDGIEQKPVISAFEIVMPLLLSSAVKDRAHVTISPAGTIDNASKLTSLQRALDLCYRISIKCPDEPAVDEYIGATLRLMNNTGNAFEAYHQAMTKAKKLFFNSMESPTDKTECLALLTSFIKSSILVSAAGREASIDAKEQMKYLTDAEAHAFQITEGGTKQDDVDETVLGLWNEAVVDLYNNMGIVEKKRGDLNVARTFFLKALQVRPNDGHALVQLASIEGNGSGEDELVSNAKELDLEYVAALFDGYSSRFESELVDVLEYKGHLLVYNALRESWKRSKKTISTVNRIVDLGCGTGLLGELVANEMPWVDIHGVDISQRMADISRQRTAKSGGIVYGTVVNGDAAQYLSTLEVQYVDCVLASDVFIYIGDISRILKEISRCLVDDGLVGFTVESYERGKKANDKQAGLKLLHSGRFGHSKAYVKEVARANGFEVSSWKSCILRKQGGSDVKGAVVILKKS